MRVPESPPQRRAEERFLRTAENPATMLERYREANATGVIRASGSLEEKHRRVPMTVRTNAHIAPMDTPKKALVNMFENR